MQTVFSLVTGMFKAVTFSSGTADERDAVNADKQHPVLKIMDAGYVSYALLGAWIETSHAGWHKRLR